MAMGRLLLTEQTDMRKGDDNMNEQDLHGFEAQNHSLLPDIVRTGVETVHMDLLESIGLRYPCPSDMPFAVKAFVMLVIVQPAVRMGYAMTKTCHDFMRVFRIGVIAQLWWAKRTRSFVIAGKQKYKWIDPADAREAIEIMTPTIWGMVYQYTKDRDEYRYNETAQEELRHMCWVKTADVYEAWMGDRGNKRGTFYYYCKVSLRHELARTIRQERKIVLEDPRIIEERFAADEPMDACDLAFRAIQKAKLNAAIPQLPPRERALIEDIKEHGEPPRKMAQRLGINVRQVYVVEKAAKRMLRDLLGIRDKRKP